MASLYFSLIKCNCQHKHTHYEQSHNKNQQKQLCVLELLKPTVGLRGNDGKRGANNVCICVCVCVCVCVWSDCQDNSGHRTAKAAKYRLIIQ